MSTSSSRTDLTASAIAWLHRSLEGSGRALAKDGLVGAVAILAAVLARIGVEQVAGGVAPFILTFPAVIFAILVSGSRAGIIAAVGCQLLTIRYVFPNWVSIHGGISTDLANVFLSTIALAGTVWATASYQRAAALLRNRCEHQVHTLSLLISEMDHRTKNNFQIAAGLLGHQSIHAGNPDLARELDKAASRLEIIASVYQDLSFDKASGGNVDLAEHIGRVVLLLQAGAASERVSIKYNASPVEVPAETAIIVGLIVNEWVTNALKHAFGVGSGIISVYIRPGEDKTEIVVRDDGTWGHTSDVAGHGSDLIKSLGGIVNGGFETEVGNGTCRTLTLPVIVRQPRR